jgi:hypothetical protein
MLGQSLTPPADWKHRAYPDAFNLDERTFPIISNGYLVSFRPRIVHPVPSDSIHLDDLATGVSRDIALSAGDGYPGWVNDVVVTPKPKQSVLVAGSVGESKDPTNTNFLEILDITGRKISSIQLGSYEPYRICATADGTFWSLGTDLKAEEAGKSYDVVRNYDSAGRLIGAYLSRQTIPVALLNWSRGAQDSDAPAGVTALQCDQSKVGIYVGPAKTWYQISLADHRLASWRIKLPGGRVVFTGLGFVKNEIYASYRLLPSPNAPSPNVPFEHGVYLLRFGEGLTASWEPLPGTIAPYSEPGSIARLVGSDSESLVYIRYLAGVEDWRHTLFWSKPTM